MSVHGDITEITFNHPMLGSGSLFAKSGEGNTYDPGGIRTADDSNSITGNGDLMYQKNRVRGFFEATIQNDQNVRNDAAIVAALQADPLEADWTFSIINGTTFAGKGKPVGDINPDLNAGTFTLKVTGREFLKIVG